jgi:hypothetical protein
MQIFIAKIFKNLIFLVCGARLVEQSGAFEYTSSHAFEHCVWYLSVKAGYYLEVTVESLVMASNELRNCSINKLEVTSWEFFRPTKLHYATKVRKRNVFFFVENCAFPKFLQHFTIFSCMTTASLEKSRHE